MSTVNIDPEAPFSTKTYRESMNAIQKVIAYIGIGLMWLGMLELAWSQAWLQLIGFLPLWFLFTKFFGVPIIIALLRTRRITRILNFKRKLLIQVGFLFVISFVLGWAGYLIHGLGPLFVLGGITSGLSMPMNYLLADVKTP